MTTVVEQLRSLQAAVNLTDRQHMLDVIQDASTRLTKGSKTLSAEFTELLADRADLCGSPAINLAIRRQDLF
ncbi:MAG: hypothetical protein U9P00_01540 [Pseudomonadota bacterium]|nr:hypothetical protein [Pseudomonadota bacterium]